MPSKPRGPILGIDFGTKRIGLAISDPDARVAVPREILANNGDDTTIVQKIAAMVVDDGITTVVLGLPRSQRGKTTDMTKAATHFGEMLRAVLQIPVIMADERMTTSSVLSAPGGTGATPVDARAAAVLLQGYLDQQ